MSDNNTENICRSGGGVEVSVQTPPTPHRRQVDWYWRLEPIRRILASVLSRIPAEVLGRYYILRVLWGFSFGGDSVMDALYYDYRTPTIIKKLIWKIHNRVYF